MAAPLPVLDLAAGSTVSWVAFAFNIGLFFSQVPLMRAMWADSDASSLSRYSFLPSLLQGSSCSLWLAYSVCVLRSPALLANNVIGVLVSLLYTAVFVLKRPTMLGKAAVACQWLLAIGFTALLYSLLYAAPPPLPPARDTVASALTVAVTCVFWFSPLPALRAAAKDLDETRVPLPLTLFMTATVVLWLVAGALLGDVSLVASSAVGIACCLLQLGVVAYIKCCARKRLLSAAAASDASVSA